MEPNEGGCYNFPEQATEDASSISSASAYPAYASALSPNVRLCGPDVITTAGSIMTNGTDCLPGELPGDTAVSFGRKAGLFSEINETQDISFASDRQESFHCEALGSDRDSTRDSLPVFSPPDILSSSGRIMSAAVGRSMEASRMENSARGGEQNKQPEYGLCFQGNEDLHHRFIYENSVDGMQSRAADQDADDFVVAFSQSHLFRTFDLEFDEDSETKKPLRSTMQNYKQSYSYSVPTHGFAKSAETAAVELKSDDLDSDKAIGKVKDADSLMSVSSPVFSSIASGMPLKETSDVMECLSFGPLSSSVDAGGMTNNSVDFPEGSGSLCAAGALDGGSGSSQSLASFINNVDCHASDVCKDKELSGYGLRNCSSSLCDGEKDEIFDDKPTGQNPKSLQNPVLCDSDGVNRSNRMDKESLNGTLHLAPSDVHDEESLCLFSSEASSSLPTAFRLSGSCSSDNSSRSGSISSTGGKISDTSALDNDKAMKTDAPNKCTPLVYSNKAENHSSAVSISPAASNSDSSRGIPVTLARVQPVFQPSSSGPSSSSYEVPQNISLSPPLSSNINLPITQLGRVAPTWLPDSEAPRCMQCDASFSFTRRRHHCRACGKIFCGSCSNLKSVLHYLENKESRVCSKCYQDLIRAQYYQKIHRKSQLRPNPNNPSEYCSVISPLLQVQSLSAVPLPSIMVPTSGVLRKQGSFKCKSEAKQVMFSDGIRPGGDLTEADGVGRLRSASANVVRQTERMGKPGSNYTAPGDVSTGGKLPIVSRQNTCLIPSFGGLPPVVVNSSSNKGYSLMDSPTMEFVLHHVRNADLPVPVTFVIDKYLAVIVKIVNLDCCISRVCWSFTTKGMRSVGQDEIVILLECLPDEQTLPADMFLHLHSIYQQASQGNPVNSMGHTILPPGCFGSTDHGGFLFIRHTFQCLERLILPEPPFLFGILLQKWEIAWAKVFPLRLLLRLGAEFRYYPCPLVSVRDRRPVYGEIGHTIMNLLADFHNYQYMVSHISGLVIHLEEKKTTVRIPSTRYDAVMKVLNSTNGHVLALGADFSTSADSHLVCMQNDDGSYQTQAINHQRKACKVTGASFAVFNGALKPTPGTLAKSSVVEDGVMIQVAPATMSEIKQSWKNMKDVTIDCSCLGSGDVVTIEWVDDSNCTSASNNLKSPVDGMPLDGKEMRRIHSATDYAYDDHVIRWTEIFLLCNETNESTNVNRLIDQVAQTACTALVSHSSQLTEEQMTKIGLRVTVGSAEVSFKAGSNNHSLPDSCIDELEEKLLPLLQKYLSSSPSSALAADQQGSLAVELIFNVLHLSSMIASTYAVNLPD